MHEKFRYIAFNKPYGVLPQFTSDKGVRNLSEFNLPKDVYPAGRLDKDSEGLLLLTDDGPFIHRFLNPRFEHERTYLVQVDYIPSDEALARLAEGVDIPGYHTRPCRVRRMPPEFSLPDREPPIRVRKSIPTAWIELKLIEGKNRQVRHMTAAVGHPTLRLVRTAMGKLELGNLASGSWRDVERRDLA